MSDITVEELKEKLSNKENFVFIDVREQSEYDEFNLGATLIPLGTLTQSLNALEEHKNDEIIIHCRSGARSGAAKTTLTQLGFSNVRNLLGGVLEWQKMYGSQSVIK